jgi:tetratricopeptide (TPR) repeat protein
LAAQILLEDGFSMLDPSHPLGGRDGTKDAVAWRSGEKWVMAAYFPRGQKSLREIGDKFKSDFDGVAKNDAKGLVFVTNQELSLGERSNLQKGVPGATEIYHLERVTAILDKPSMQSVRSQFLGIGRSEGAASLSPVFVRTIPSSFRVSDGLIGRTDELEALLQFLDPSSGATGQIAVVITGMPGVGKTALALQAASNALSKDMFAGGAISIDFNGYAVDASDRVKPQQILSSALVALGYTENEYEPSVMLVRLQSMLAELEASGKQVLFVFDNVAYVDQIQPLIPTSGSHRMIVTSRNSLAPRLSSSAEISLAPLSAEEGASVIAQTAQYAKGDSGQRGDVAIGLARLADICGGLPIALQLVGEILRSEQSLTPIELAQELASASTRLAGLEFEDAAIRAIFEGSYVRLSDTVKKCFRYISVHPAQEFSVDAVSALLRADRIDVRRSFRVLEGSHLIVRELDRSTWTMHDLLRLYSAELFGLQDGANEAELANSSLNDYYFSTAEQANEWLNGASTNGERAAFQDWSEARAWMSTEVSGIVASVEASSAAGEFNDAFRLAITIGLYLDIVGDKVGCLSMAEAALSAARELQDEDKEGGALNNVGLALNSMRRFDEAKGVFLRARKLFREIGNRSGEARVLLGLSDVLRAEGSIAATIAPLRRAARLYLEDDDPPGAAFALTNLGISLHEGRNFGDAIEVLTAAQRIHERAGARRAEASTLNHLGTALMQSGKPSEGLPYLLRAREYAKDVGDLAGLSAACVNIGNAYSMTGDLARAKSYYLEAVDACEQAGDLTSLASSLWNLIGLLRATNDIRGASRYMKRLRSIPRHDLSLDMKRRLS